MKNEKKKIIAKISQTMNMHYPWIISEFLVNAF